MVLGAAELQLSPTSNPSTLPITFKTTAVLNSTFYYFLAFQIRSAVGDGNGKAKRQRSTDKGKTHD
jgi:hypothetical protein